MRIPSIHIYKYLVICILLFSHKQHTLGIAKINKTRDIKNSRNYPHVCFSLNLQTKVPFHIISPLRTISFRSYGWGKYYNIINNVNNENGILLTYIYL